MRSKRLLLSLALLAAVSAVVVVSASTVVVQDTFTGTIANLETTTASPTGGAWSEVINSTGTHLERHSSGYARLVGAFANSGIVDLVAPSPALSGTSYDVQFKASGVLTTATNPSGMVFGYVDTSNYCTAFYYGSLAATDLYIAKVVAGVFTDVGTPINTDTIAGDIYTIEVRGSSLTLKKNTVSVITGTASECAVGTGVGIGMGTTMHGGSTDDGATGTQFDDFTVTDQGGALRPGGSLLGLIGMARW